MYKLPDGTETSNLTTYIIALVGNQNNLSKILGVCRSSINGYIARGYPPAKYACDIEDATSKRVTARMVCEAVKAATIK